MKGEYVEPKTENPNNMFSKLHNNYQQHHPLSHHFQLSRESPTPNSNDTTATPDHPTGGGSGSGGGRGTIHGDGDTIEVVRRPRGRPPGSRNKHKSPVITREPDPVMTPYILEVPGGNDVVEAVSGFSRRKNVGICVLTGSGAVSNVTLRQPSTTPGATVTFNGRFDILSLSATFLPQTTSSHHHNVPNSFSISLAGPQGQIVGGFVAGSLLAAGTVFIVAATFNNPSYHRLPGEDKDNRNTVSYGGGEGQSPPLSGGGGDSGHGGGADSCGVSMYSCHLGGSDVIWAPTARPPPPY